MTPAAKTGFAVGLSMLAAVCLTVTAARYPARDGGEPPRDGTRAEVSRPEASAPVRAGQPGTSRFAGAARNAADSGPAGFAELERRLADNPGARDLVLQKLLPALFEQDPEGAARFAELQSEPALRELAVRQVALLWGARDAERAVNWARTLPDAAEREATYIDIANGFSSLDPAGAVALREQFAGNAHPDSALSNLVQQWAGFDFDAALAWTNARPAGAQRDDLLQRLIYVRAASGEPAAAAELVDESALIGEAKAAAVASVAQEWAQHDDAAARDWQNQQAN